MENFIQRFGDKITGILSGYDRLIIHGTLRRLCYPVGMGDFLFHSGVLLKDFSNYAQRTTGQLKKLTEERASKLKRPMLWIGSSDQSKEAIAMQVAREDKVEDGLIAIIKALEPCRSLDIHRNREEKKLELVYRERKCLHYYYYFFDNQFGFIHARIQTWFPFKIQIYLNGREWLSRQMQQAGLRFEKMDNSFVWIEDFKEAQRLMNQQLTVNWPAKLNRIARILNPAHSKVFANYPQQYYWTVAQSEWATDLLFKDHKSLAEIYRFFTLYGIANFKSGDVMRFLGKKLSGQFQGEVMSKFKGRREGVCLKHWMGKNSIKLYDKFGLILRVEVTVNHPRIFWVYRPIESQKSGTPQLARLRSGIADLKRRSAVCQAANERYLNALASVDTSTTLSQLLRPVCYPVQYNGKRIRALNPLAAADFELLSAISRGEFLLGGFRNKDLQPILYSNLPTTQKEKQRRSARVSRLLRLLRAHKLIQRLPRCYKYVVTLKGRQILNALFSLETLNVQQVYNAAA